MTIKPLSFRAVPFLWFLALASPALANDDMSIFSGVTQLSENNGWGDWGWVPHYITNSPAWNGHYTMVIAASGGNQAWYIHHDLIDTTIYSSISFWLNGGSSGGQAVGLQAQPGSDSGPWGPRINVTAPTNSWQQFTFSLSALGVNNTNLQAIQIWGTGTAQPRFYLADVRLVAAPAPATVHVSVGLSQARQTVNPDMLGVNQVAWDGAIATPTTISLLNAMGNPCLRWPGGSWGDGYHWTNEAWSYGNTSPRNWGSFSTNFIQVATNMHAQAFIIVNYGTSSPEEAAWGVRMFNLTNHCNFKYWEIGNEVGGSWEVDNNTNSPWKPHDPWTYAMRFTNYYAQMKAADPTIQIGAVADVTEDGTSNYNDHPVINPRTGVKHYGWTPVMLTYMRSNDCLPDFLIEHIYGPADGDTQDLLWYGKIQPDAVSLRQMLTDYLGSAGSNVTLECTECGLGGDRQTCSLVGGLTYLDSLGEFLQTEFQSHIWWDFRNGQSALGSSDPSYYGWRTNSSGQYLADGGIVNGLGDVTSTRYPTFYCAKLAAHFVSGGDQVVAATSDYPLLATYAVFQPDGALNLLIINKSSYTNLTVAFNLANLYEPSPDATTWSYGIPQDNAAETGIGSPDIAQGSLSGAAGSFSDTFAPYSATVINLVPTAPVLTALAGSPPGQFVCQLQGLFGVPYVIEMTTDLAAGNWVPISTNTLTSGPRGTTPLNITNNTSSSAAFYRAIWKP
ncbi:MAG TPA: alpha-L-arabinofuranosidase [Verrucomicrobiae bacterium]|nr:alpha-L-arabinofuranosidase [Verrucomicrobiae bacterium]